MPPTGSGEWAGTQPLGTAGNGPCTKGVSVTCVPEHTPEAAEGPQAELEGHKVRLFLKWTAGEAGGRGQRRGIWLCAPWSLAPGAAAHHPGLGQPMVLPGAGDGAQQSAEGALGKAAGAGGVLPHLPSPMGRDTFPRFCWLGGARLCTQLPGSHGAGGGASLCGEGQGRQPGHRSPQSLEYSEADGMARGPRGEGSGRLTGRPHSGPKSSLGHSCPNVARDQQVITLQLQWENRERPRERQPVPQATQLPTSPPPADRVVTCA